MNQQAGTNGGIDLRAITRFEAVTMGNDTVTFQITLPERTETLTTNVAMAWKLIESIGEVHPEWVCVVAGAAAQTPELMAAVETALTTQGA